MLLVLSLVTALKQRFNKHINGKSQTKRDQKLNLLFLQRQCQEFWFKRVKNRQKNITKGLIFTTLGKSQFKRLIIVKIFTV